MFHKNFLVLSFILFSAGFYFSCQTNSLFLESESVAEMHRQSLQFAISERDVSALLRFTTDQDDRYAALAWKGLALSEPDSSALNVMLSAALNEMKKGAWFALSFLDLSEEVEVQLKERFLEGLIEPTAACLFFSRKGTLPVLKMMLSDRELLRDPSCSSAAGQMIRTVELYDLLIDEIISIIYESDDQVLRSHLLYGFWRSALNRPAQGGDSHQRVMEMLQTRADLIPEMEDEFLLRIAGRPAFGYAVNRVRQSDPTQNVQFAVETASLLQAIEREAVDFSEVGFLLEHPNPNVILQVLESLKKIPALETSFLESVWLAVYNHHPIPEAETSFFELMQEQGQMETGSIDQLNQLLNREPLLTNRILNLYQLHVSQEQYLSKLGSLLQGEGIASMHAAAVLTEYVESHPLPRVVAEQVGELFRKELFSFNRSLISASEPLLLNPYFLPDRELNRLNDLLIQAQQEEEASLFYLIERVMRGRGVLPDFSESSRKSFRFPDQEWSSDSLRSYYWVLETTQGEIRIRLDSDSAPFTVSSTIELTESGLVDGVAFHRVVRNFVIQGGDFDRRDGFGGPDYRIPTEPSFDTFRRGSVGMASSGPDTEGSQFFITHTWTPHLDGLYTLFGTVVEGMDVVDRIRLGDKVLRARIEGE